jgi:hypothetical protein
LIGNDENCIQGPFFFKMAADKFLDINFH